MDDLGADAKMVCILDHAGNVLAGKLPPAPSCVISAGLICLALNLETMGRKRK